MLLCEKHTCLLSVAQKGLNGTMRSKMCWECTRHMWILLFWGTPIGHWQEVQVSAWEDRTTQRSLCLKGWGPRFQDIHEEMRTWECGERRDYKHTGRMWVHLQGAKSKEVTSFSIFIVFVPMKLVQPHSSINCSLLCPQKWHTSS